MSALVILMAFLDLLISVFLIFYVNIKCWIISIDLPLCSWFFCQLKTAELLNLKKQMVIIQLWIFDFIMISIYWFSRWWAIVILAFTSLRMASNHSRYIYSTYFQIFFSSSNIWAPSEIVSLDWFFFFCPFVHGPYIIFSPFSLLSSPSQDKVPPLLRVLVFPPIWESLALIL